MAEIGTRKNPFQKTRDVYIMRSIPNITAPTGNVGHKLLKITTHKTNIYYNFFAYVK
jgi:hypothetical protein